jgi:hypothetical protein
MTDGSHSTYAFCEAKVLERMSRTDALEIQNVFSDSLLDNLLLFINTSPIVQPTSVQILDRDVRM